MGWSEVAILDGYTTVESRRKEVIRMTTSNVNNQKDKDIKEQEILTSLKSENYNKVTIAAIEEGRKIAKDPNAKGYRSVEELRNRL